MATVSQHIDTLPGWEQTWERSLRAIRIRWGLLPCMAAAVWAAHAAGVEFAAWKVLLIAAFIFLYNSLFHILLYRQKKRGRTAPAECRQMAVWQTAADGAALTALAYISGGVSGPFTALLVLPVVRMSTLLPGRTSYLFAAAILAALCLTALAEFAGWLSRQPVWFGGGDIASMPHPWRGLIHLTVLGAILFGSAALAGRTARGYQRKLLDLNRLREAEVVFGRRLQSIFSILETIGTVRNLSQVLETAVSEVAMVMQVKGVSVKLLSDDGKFLRYAAAFGLPEAMVREKLVEVDRSPLNKRIIDGELFITGQVTAGQMFQFGETLSAAQIQSVLFVPLHLDGRVIGILGAYCEKADRFGPEEVDFFRLTARLVAIALDNARAYEAVQDMSRERTWFMMKVAHNLRAPLAGMLSILDVVREGYLGPLNDEQKEYLRRLDRRARTLLAIINELMALSRNRERRDADPNALTDPADLVRRIRRTFQDKAAEKRIALHMALPEDIPPLRGELETVEQVLENLVSNAIKYTPEDGSVEVRFGRANNTVRIEVSDTGIGIPAGDRPKLFTEFFRAENAKSMEEVGTGLGLAIVKEFVDKLGGRILVESEEGVGTIFVVHLPVAPAGKEARQ